jgi:uracil-DNA glycosylase
MNRLVIAPNFSSWREAARRALHLKLPPQDVVWQAVNQDAELQSLFPPIPENETIDATARVPRKFLKLAQNVSCYRDGKHWSILYRMLWRLTHGEAHLLQMATDPDVVTVQRMAQEIGRDVHKMRAFVRFREIVLQDDRCYVAWFEPSHRILRLNTSFFVERFAQMKWAILTPDECVSWDGMSLSFRPGVTKEAAPAEDEVESIWRTYYRSVFNPARVKTSAMLAEMPKKYWPNLPETKDIPDLLQQAPLRVERMLADGRAPTPAEHSPAVPQTDDLEVIRSAAAGCRVCPWASHATQTVFGEGPRTARIVFVGEQPGDHEDRAGRPFVGPAGALFERALAEAGIDRQQCYVTNAVKHFKWQPRGKRRLHEKPSSRDLQICRVWLESELRSIAPELLICLGATAATSVFGREVKVLQERGSWRLADSGIKTLITVHPSSILRVTESEAQAKAYADFVADLTLVPLQLAGRPPSTT